MRNLAFVLACAALFCGETRANYHCDGKFSGICGGSYVDTNGKTGAFALVADDNSCIASVQGSTDFDGLVKCNDMRRQLDGVSCNTNPAPCAYHCEGKFSGTCGNTYVDTNGRTGAYALVKTDNSCIASVQAATDFDGLAKCTQMLRQICL
jgi:hypothetical protein